jgi:phosphoglycolate phosphatase-like HAD superfamily hydrolase
MDRTVAEDRDDRKVTLLPSWRPGAARQALLAFLDEADGLPVERRVAYFDNDGTLWCERPTYIQYEFFLDALRRRVADDPTVGERAEFAAVLTGSAEEIAAIGLPRVAMALAGLFEGLTPEEFAERVRTFLATAVHPQLRRPLRSLVYQPMRELIDELRRRTFTVGIVTGGGTEFLRAVSARLYGVPPELVVGTHIVHELTTTAAGAPELRRTSRLLGEANEGAAKVGNIQTQMGRRPILSVGNSAGDREMLEWACAAPGPGLALLVEHDDAEREFAYASEAVTLPGSEPIAQSAARSGWTTVSMAADWETVFPVQDPP